MNNANYLESSCLTADEHSVLRIGVTQFTSNFEKLSEAKKTLISHNIFIY